MRRAKAGRERSSAMLTLHSFSLSLLVHAVPCAWCAALWAHGRNHEGAAASALNNGQHRCKAHTQQTEAVSAILPLIAALQVLVLPVRYNVRRCLPHAVCFAEGHPSRTRNGEHEGTCNARCSAAQHQSLYRETCSGRLSTWAQCMCISNRATYAAQRSQQHRVSHAFNCCCIASGAAACLNSEVQRVWVRRSLLSRS